jgi:hypothetical protein
VRSYLYEYKLWVLKLINFKKYVEKLENTYVLGNIYNIQHFQKLNLFDVCPKNKSVKFHSRQGGLE